MKTVSKNILSLGLLGFILVFNPGCSTKKNTLVSRNYHNITSHYNIFFNAYEIKREGHKKVESTYQDDFNMILPIDIYSQRQVASRLLPDMDKVIRKCSKVITLHSITAKPKRKKRGNTSERQKDFYKKNEFNRWIDDAYLLMGQAYFLKNDQFPAIQNFEYVIRQFPTDGLKQEANLWLAKCHLALKDYDTSIDFLDRLEADPELRDDLRPEIAIIRADWNLRQENTEEAINYLLSALELVKDKKKLTRLTYIVAQLFEQEEDFVQASLKYKEVIDLNPNYRMQFNAKINRAKLYQGDADTGREIRKQLVKMLKDDKNIEFLDQVYYAIAELDMKEGLEDSAVENYKLSAQSSLGNTHQQALSYQALGEIYYSKDDYLPAQVYYDSCMMTIPELFPDREDIETLSLGLNILAENLRLINREDSLQMVAAMPEAERNVLIDIKIDEAKRAEDEAKRKEEEERLNGRSGGFRSASQGGPGGNRMSMSQGGMGGPGGNGGNRGGSNMGGDMSNAMGGTQSSWYFYNPTTLSFGQGEFAKLWGRRKLEDNWRRTNKGITSSMGDMSTEGEEGDVLTPKVTSNAGKFTPTQKEFYTADLPLTDTLIAESNDRIQSALFNVGKIFKDELNKEPESIANFKILLERFPETDRQLFTYYNLYQIFDANGNTEQAEYYKGLIVSQFPDSRSAKIISNPNYFKEIEEARLQVISLYAQTYEEFLKGNYAQVVSECERADTAYGLNHIRDKFGLLKVMSMGALDPENTTVLANRLNELVFQYPESDVKEVAGLMLNYLENGPTDLGAPKATGTGGLSIGKVESLIEEEAEYVFDEEVIHFYVAVVSRRTQDLNRLSFNISNFNIENFDQDFFDVTNTPMNEDLMIIIVKNFSEAKKGLEYYNALSADPVVFEGFDDRDYRHFIISKDNYTNFYKNKNVFKYIKFFNENYLDEDN